MSAKKLLGVYGSGSQHWVGDGFPVRNLFPSNGLSQEISPFLLFDYAGPAEFPPTDEARGVDEHPHRGFETVTIVYHGELAHRDSAGNSGTIGPGDVQWMTAASGVVHEEKHAPAFSRRGGLFQVVQLWVNLPRAHKMSPPRYQEIKNAQIAVVNLSGGTARVIAGELGEVRGPAKTFTPINLFDLRLSAGKTSELKLVDGHNTAVVVLEGKVRVNGSDPVAAAQLALLAPQGESVSLVADTDAIALVLSGEPINEPVASRGPFVMNTQEELMQAAADYRSGKMGRL